MLACSALELININSLLLQPILGLVHNDGLTLSHSYSQVALILVQKLSLAHVLSLGHASGHSILVHEHVVPVHLVVEVLLEHLLLLLLILAAASSKIEEG